MADKGALSVINTDATLVPYTTQVRLYSEKLGKSLSNTIKVLGAIKYLNK